MSGHKLGGARLPDVLQTVAEARAFEYPYPFEATAPAEPRVCRIASIFVWRGIVARHWTVDVIQHAARYTTARQAYWYSQTLD